MDTNTNKPKIAYPVGTTLLRTDGLLCVQLANGYARDIHGRNVDVGAGATVVTNTDVVCWVAARIHVQR